MPKVWNKRDKKLPPEAVYVGRPGKWGNPFVIGMPDPLNSKVLMDRHRVVKLYEQQLQTESARPYLDIMKQELKGKDLACWCSPAECHADVILRIVNADENKTEKL